MKERPPELQGLLDAVFPSANEQEVWLDSRIPVLRGKTPREVLASGPQGVKDVVSILGTYVNGEFL